MIQDIIKEIRYGIRNNRFLIVIAGFLFFAISTPLMAKVVLPQILKSQFPGLSEQEMASMLDLTQLGTIRSYMGDVFEIGSLIIAFTLCGLIAQEIRDNTLVLPLCSGKRISGIVSAKMLVFGALLLLTPLTALVIDYLYAGVLFSFDIALMPIVRAGLLQGIYMVFLLACLVLWGAIIKKPIAAGFLSLATSFGLHFLGGLLDIHAWLPSGLLIDAQLLAVKPAPTLIWTLLITLAVIVAMVWAAGLRLKKMEWNER